MNEQMYNNNPRVSSQLKIAPIDQQYEYMLCSYFIFDIFQILMYGKLGLLTFFLPPLYWISFIEPPQELEPPAGARAPG